MQERRGNKKKIREIGERKTTEKEESKDRKKKEKTMAHACPIDPKYKERKRERTQALKRETSTNQRKGWDKEKQIKVPEEKRGERKQRVQRREKRK